MNRKIEIRKTDLRGSGICFEGKMQILVIVKNNAPDSIPVAKKSALGDRALWVGRIVQR